MCNDCDGKCVCNYENDDCIEGHPDSDFQDPALSIEDFEECPDPDGYSDEDYDDLLNGF